MGKCLRIVFGTFNFLVFLGGCVLLGLAIWLHESPDSFNKLVGMADDAVNNTQSSEKFQEMLAYVHGSLYFAMAIGE